VKAINEPVKNLENKDKRIQSDCIKILYEIEYLKPELIAGYQNIIENRINECEKDAQKKRLKKVIKQMN